MFTAYQCPTSRRPLAMASAELVVKVNQQIAEQRLVTVEGQGVLQPVDGGWYCRQSRRFYPLRDGILCLIADQAIDLPQLVFTEQDLT
jgi:uncharacterized protein YbaR (Trm112 family)